MTCSDHCCFQPCTFQLPLQFFNVRFPTANTLEAMTSVGNLLFQRVIAAPTGVIVNLLPKSASTFSSMRSILSSRLGAPSSVFVDVSSLGLVARTTVCPGYPTLVIDNQAPNGVKCVVFSVVLFCKF
jgi:hypothetical protein